MRAVLLTPIRHSLRRDLGSQGHLLCEASLDLVGDRWGIHSAWAAIWLRPLEATTGWRPRRSIIRCDPRQKPMDRRLGRCGQNVTIGAYGQPPPAKAGPRHGLHDLERFSYKRSTPTKSSIDRAPSRSIRAASPRTMRLGAPGPL
jgi:hypothetical protein